MSKDFSGKFMNWNFCKNFKTPGLFNFGIDLWYNRRPSTRFWYPVYVDRVINHVDNITHYKVYSVDYPGETFLMSQSALEELYEPLTQNQKMELQKRFRVRRGASEREVENIFVYGRGAQTTHLRHG